MYFLLFPILQTRQYIPELIQHVVGHGPTISLIGGDLRPAAHGSNSVTQGLSHR